MTVSTAARVGQEAVQPTGKSCSISLGPFKVELLPEGGAWLEAEKTLLVADLHLEKASSFARRGWFVPPYDSASTLLSLAGLVMRLQPRRVYCLGDSFHDGGAELRLPADCAAMLAKLQAGREWTWLPGNHDPQSGALLAGARVPSGSIDPGPALHDFGGLVLRHEPDFSSTMPQVAGHLHPCARIRQRGHIIRTKAFAISGDLLILPAFGAFTGSLNVLDTAYCGLMQRRGAAVGMIGRNGVFRIAPRALLPD
jgi:uncharacterized protein